MIQKLEAHPDEHKKVLIRGLEIPRNTTRSVNTSPILDEPILDDNTPVLQPTPKFIAKGMQTIKDLVIGCWITYHQNQRWLTKLAHHLKNLINKLYNKKDTSFQLKESKSAFKKFAIQNRIDGKDGFDPDLFLINAKQSITYRLINERQYKLNGFFRV